ncbi:TlpA disulfide reductase family protein [Oceaniserpentilla sp. 4NH20-0058]|uniref:TlpA disulfide reductase family protein n=1 Tax=Oceaniserpentilla sp. 4NH20-0058 TaxID=3127660 RepID=UPI00310C3207
MKSIFLNLNKALLVVLLVTSMPTHAEQWLNKFDLSQYKNKVVYLDFWASWCGPCRKSFPWLNEIEEKYKNQGLVVIGVNLDTEQSLAKQFLKEVPANFRVFSDPDGKLAEKYKLIGMPSSFVIDGKGEVRHRHVGFKKNKTDEYEKSIESLLKELKR